MRLTDGQVSAVQGDSEGGRVPKLTIESVADKLTASLNPAHAFKRIVVSALEPARRLR